MIDLKGKSSIADSMVIASGRSQRHTVSLAGNLEEKLRKAGFEVASVEGKTQGDWLLVDAYDVIVHIFRPEIREHYNLEKMWMMPGNGENVEPVPVTGAASAAATSHVGQFSV